MPVTTAAITGGIQSAVGIAQYIKGAKIAKNNKRPDYEIPSEIKDNLSQAQMMTLEGLPSEQKQQYLENVQRTQNQGLNVLGDRQAGIAGLASLTQEGDDANRNLLSMDAEARQRNQEGLMNARTQMAGYKDKGFELNKLLPFQANAQAAQGLQNAGLHNAMSGLQSAQGSYENMELAKLNNPTTAPVNPALGTNSAVSKLPSQGPQRTDVVQQYQIAKLSNPTLTIADFMRTQGQGTGLGFANNLTY